MAQTAEAVNERLNEENLKLAEVLQENELLKQRVTALEARKDWTEQALTALMSKHWAGTWNGLVIDDNSVLYLIVRRIVSKMLVRFNVVRPTLLVTTNPADSELFMEVPDAL